MLFDSETAIDRQIDRQTVKLYLQKINQFSLTINLHMGPFYLFRNKNVIQLLKKCTFKFLSSSFHIKVDSFCLYFFTRGSPSIRTIDLQ